MINCNKKLQFIYYSLLITNLENLPIASHQQCFPGFGATRKHAKQNFSKLNLSFIFFRAFCSLKSTFNFQIQDNFTTQ